jgi:hypothetical protein
MSNISSLRILWENNHGIERKKLIKKHTGNYVSNICE